VVNRVLGYTCPQVIGRSIMHTGTYTPSRSTWLHTVTNGTLRTVRLAIAAGADPARDNNIGFIAAVSFQNVATLRFLHAFPSIQAAMRATTGLPRLTYSVDFQEDAKNMSKWRYLQRPFLFDVQTAHQFRTKFHYVCPDWMAWCRFDVIWFIVALPWCEQKPNPFLGWSAHMQHFVAHLQ
jgi:hypothetical protein